MEKLTKQQTAFLNEIQNLTAKEIIRWEREGDQLVATMSLKLHADFFESEDSEDPLRSVVVSGAGPEIEVYLPVSADVLPDQWVEVEGFEEEKTADVAAVAE